MVNIQQLLQFDDDFISAKLEKDKLKVLEQYPKFDHPHYYYRIAEAYYLRFNNYEKSRTYVKKCMKYGFKSKNQYANGAFADSIAQCMLAYLMNETIDLRSQFNLSCLCYSYFSKMIEKFGTNAYNSLYSRGRLVKMNDSNPGVKKMINSYYY